MFSHLNGSTSLNTNYSSVAQNFAQNGPGSGVSTLQSKIDNSIDSGIYSNENTITDVLPDKFPNDLNLALKSNINDKNTATETTTTVESPYTAKDDMGNNQKGSDNDVNFTKEILENSWQEVKRKSKETKLKKESKEKETRYEREELEFHFDEDLDQEVPTGRQNTFSTDW